MKLVDANVLLYAVNPDAAEHRVAKNWLDNALSGGAPVGFTWLVLLAFVRITTHPRIFERPMTHEQAMGQVTAWLEAAPATILQPKATHAATLAQMLSALDTGGKLTNDAHLAAIAAEHRASIVSFDSDFSRFPGVRWERPA